MYLEHNYGQAEKSGRVTTLCEIIHNLSAFISEIYSVAI